jgi:hypothetical protein
LSVSGAPRGRNDIGDRLLSRLDSYAAPGRSPHRGIIDDLGTAEPTLMLRNAFDRFPIRRQPDGWHADLPSVVHRWEKLEQFRELGGDERGPD